MALKPCLWSPQDFLGPLAVQKELRRKSALITSFPERFRPESEDIVKDGSGHGLCELTGLGFLETFHPQRRSCWAPLPKLPAAPTCSPPLLTALLHRPPCSSPASHPCWDLDLASSPGAQGQFYHCLTAPGCLDPAFLPGNLQPEPAAGI